MLSFAKWFSWRITSKLFGASPSLAVTLWKNKISKWGKAAYIDFFGLLAFFV